MTFFSGPEALEALSQRGDPLQRLAQTVDFESFRGGLERALYKPAKGPGGAPRWDAVLMFKLLVLQRLYNLSDEQAEYQVSDRLSFRRFLGLSLCDTVPDSRTVWLFRETIVEAGTGRSSVRIVLLCFFTWFLRALWRGEGVRWPNGSGEISDA